MNVSILILFSFDFLFLSFIEQINNTKMIVESPPGLGWAKKRPQPLYGYESKKITLKSCIVCDVEDALKRKGNSMLSCDDQKEC